MEPDYHVPANRSPSPYRWHMIIRLIIAVFGGFFPMIYTIGYQLYFYQQNILRGDTFQHYVRLTPAFWIVFPLSLALLWLLLGIGRDGWVLAKRRGTPTLLPWPYRFALLFAAIAVVLYVRTIRIP